AYRNADRHRARRAVPHRAVHRRPAARAGDLPAPDPGWPDARRAARREAAGQGGHDHHDDAGGRSLSTATTTPAPAATPERAAKPLPPISWKAPIAYAVI